MSTRGEDDVEPKPTHYLEIGVSVAEGMSAEEVKDKVIECCCVGNPGDNVWEFMRIRYDKDHPNAWKTYEKVKFRTDICGKSSVSSCRGATNVGGWRYWDVARCQVWEIHTRLVEIV